MSSLRKGLLMRIAPGGVTTGNVNNTVKKRGNNGFSASQAILLRKLRKVHPKADYKIIKAILWKILSDPSVASAYISPPTGDNVNNCWKYTNTGGGDNITWYFYVDPDSVGSVIPGYPDWTFPVAAGSPPSLYNVSDLEAFYFTVKINNNQLNNIPWPTIYTRTTSMAQGVWYNTRIAYTGLHDIESIPPGKYTFTLGNTNKLIKTEAFNSGTLYNLDTYDISATKHIGDGGGSVDPSMYRNEDIAAITLNTNTIAAAGTYDFCLIEVGYKIKGLVQEVIKTVAR